MDCVGNMSILSVESHWQREQKRHGHIYGGRGKKRTSETKHDTKHNYKIIYTVQLVSEIRYTMMDLL